MRALVALALVACSASPKHSAAPSGTDGAAGADAHVASSAAAKVVSSDPGATVTIDGDTATVTFASPIGQMSCGDGASIQVTDASGTREALTSLPMKGGYVLDGVAHQFGAENCDDWVCSKGGTELRVPLTEFKQIGKAPNGDPSYATTPVAGTIAVTVHTHTPGCTADVQYHFTVVR